MNALKEGFAYIGFGLMVLFICHGCSHCTRVKIESEILSNESEARIEKEAK